MAAARARPLPAPDRRVPRRSASDQPLSSPDMRPDVGDSWAGLVRRETARSAALGGRRGRLSRRGRVDDVDRIVADRVLPRKPPGAAQTDTTLGPGGDINVVYPPFQRPAVQQADGMGVKVCDSAAVARLPTKVSAAALALLGQPNWPILTRTVDPGHAELDWYPVQHNELWPKEDHARVWKRRVCDAGLQGSGHAGYP